MCECRTCLCGRELVGVSALGEERLVEEGGFRKRHQWGVAGKCVSMRA